MKRGKTHLYSMLTVLLTALAFVTFAAGQVLAWDTDNVYQDSGLSAWNEIAVDSSGNQHLVFASEEGTLAIAPQLRYAYNDGSGWTVYGPIAYGPVGMDINNFTFSLALDSNDDPHVTYYVEDSIEGTKTIYHTFSDDNGATWSAAEILVSNASLNPGETLTPVHDFAIDTSSSSPGRYYLYHVVTGDAYRYIRRMHNLNSGDGWNIDPALPTIEIDGISELSLVANAGHVAFVCTMYESGMDPELGYYTIITLNQWDDQRDDYANVASKYFSGLVSGSSDYGSSLALDVNGDSHISYMDGYDVVYAFDEVATTDDPFTPVTVYTGASMMGRTTDIAVDSSNYPHIVYGESTEMIYSLGYAKESGTGWSTEVVGSFSGYWPVISLALDLSNPLIPAPHISHEVYDTLPSVGHTSPTLDSDGDGVADDVDNCSAVYNPTQADNDGDLIGDACDNCPAAVNNDQANDDDDEMGDVCDPCPTNNLNDCPQAGQVDGLTAELQTPSQTLEVTPGDPIPVELCQQNPEDLDEYTIFDCFTVTYQIKDSSGNVLPTKHKDRTPYIIGTPADPRDVVTIPAHGQLCITCYVEDGVEFPLPGPGDSETFTGDVCATNYITDRDLLPDGTCLAGEGDCFDLKIGTVCAALNDIDMINRETVNIDIKPGTQPNSINLGSNGKVPVAILSSSLFDATTIDPLTVELAGATVAFKGKSDNPLTSVEDVDGDGLSDLIVHIDTEGFLLTDGDVSAELIAEARKSNGDVLYIRGEDSIRVVPDN